MQFLKSFCNRNLTPSHPDPVARIILKSGKVLLWDLGSSPATCLICHVNFDPQLLPFPTCRHWEMRPPSAWTNCSNVRPRTVSLGAVLRWISKAWIHDPDGNRIELMEMAP